MIPLVATQVRAVIEGIRLLEAVVTSPLGLYADVKMLRESLSFPEAGEISREETQERRSSLMTATEAPLQLGLQTVRSVRISLDLLERTKGDGASPLQPEWVSRARGVLDRSERRIAEEVRAQSVAKIRGLYVIIDPEATKGLPVLEVAEATLKGGTRVLQLRDKTNDKAEVLSVIRQLKSLCDSYDALLVVNDDADVAVVGGAHGLHVGQTDLRVAEARRILDPAQLVGRSNNGVEQAMDSRAQGADYLAVGAIYATATMGKTTRSPVGTEMVSKIKELVSQPVVAIGGINLDNIGQVVRAGADCVCVVSAVTFADDPEAATLHLVEAMDHN